MLIFYKYYENCPGQNNLLLNSTAALLLKNIFKEKCAFKTLPSIFYDF